MEEFSIQNNNFLSDNILLSDMETLIDEVRKLASDRKSEMDFLKLQEMYRREFLGNVSHELKTPLFTIQGYILTLLEGAIDDKMVLKKYLTRANKGVDRLTYIIKDLDVITQLELGETTLDYTNFDIVSLIKNVIDMIEMRAQKSSISLEFDHKKDVPIMVCADEDKIQQVITNLLINSIKYGKKKGTTEISVHHYKNDQIIVRIADNGEGISSEHLPRLFERFYRVDKSGNRKQGGSGIGLSIVKHIIEAHQQKIFVESELEIGSEFSFTLKKPSKEREI